MRTAKVSRTALGVAHWIVFASCYPELAQLLPPGAADATLHLLRASGQLRRLHWALMQHRWFRAYVRAVINLWVPGIGAHLALRKRFFDEEVRRSLREGARHAVVLGAGFDTLCLRQSEAHPGAQFIEVDHPATSALKRAALEKAGLLRPNLHLLPVDLASASLEQALLDCPSYQREGLSVFVAEGLLMYLPEVAVRGLLDCLHRLTPPGSRFLFSYLQTDSQGTAHIGRFPRLLNLQLRLAGEPFGWGIFPERLAHYLEERDLRLISRPSHYELMESYCAGPKRPFMPEDFAEQFAVAVNC